MTGLSYGKQIKALSRIGKAITSYVYIDETLNFIVSITAEVMNSRICSLFLVNEQNELVIRAVTPANEAYAKKKPIKIGEGIAGKVAKENKPIIISDVKNEPVYVYREIAKKEGLCSLLSVPLSVKGNVLGVLNCYTGAEHEFSEEETTLLLTIANQAAVVIENAQLLLKTRQIQEELEARKIIERAKGILMKAQGLSEEQAFKRIQKKSMDMRKSMKEIAEAIILTSEISK